ncbi:MAG: hypothetical protein ACRC5M_03670, partial [Anaeroplasmataceae bacterium]
DPDLSKIYNKYYENDGKSFISIIKDNQALDIEQIKVKLINLAEYDDEYNDSCSHSTEIHNQIADGFAKLNQKIGA